MTLALWLQSGASRVDRAAAAVQGEDEPHRVVGHQARTLDELVARWLRGPRTVAAVLPVPGDPIGTPAVVAADAVLAGECLLVRTPHGAWAAVPQVERFGSPLEPGHQVTWQVRPVPDWHTGLVAAVGSLADAERELRAVLARATQTLDTLDVAHWGPGADAAVAAVRDSAPPWRLPPGLEPRRLRVLTAATRVHTIAELARADDGAAVTVWQADQRSTALRDVHRASRRAIVAATLATVDGAVAGPSA